jgi:dolichyl-phosphate-mannose-protein mannosyltransferase
VTLIALTLSFSTAASAAAAARVTNGLFSSGEDGHPGGWRGEAYFSGPDAVAFNWYVDSVGVGEVKIDNLKPNDSRWVQNAPVRPSTWYHVAGWIRCDSVGTGAMGAYLAVGETGHRSADLRGTQTWQRVDFWTRTLPNQTLVELQCRLGGFSSLNTGSAYFTGISLVEGNLPASGEQDLGSALEDHAQRTVLLALMVVLGGGGLVLLIWGLVAPASWRIPP